MAGKNNSDCTALHVSLSRHVVALGGQDSHSVSLTHSSYLALMEAQKDQRVRARGRCPFHCRHEKREKVGEILLSHVSGERIQ